MNLARLLETVPTLLQACVGGEIAAWKRLRLVDKTFCRIALLALKSYTLKLTGDPKDTNVCGARLLRHTQLQALHVSLALSGNFSPAMRLETFVRNVETALSTVSSLYLHLQDTGTSAATYVLLSNELGLLLAACPSLTSLTVCGYVCPRFLKMAGQACPLVSDIIVNAQTPQEIPHMMKTVLQLPSLLPHLSRLGVQSVYPVVQLPDMCQFQGILELDLGCFEFYYGVDWCCLPPNLRHLKCGNVHVGPPILRGRRSLMVNLQSLSVFSTRLSLHTLAQLIRSAPLLYSLHTWSDNSDNEIEIAVSFDLSTADDLCLLASSNRSFLQNPLYIVNCRTQNTVESEVAPFLLSLPIMTGVKRCKIRDCFTKDLGPLLSIFPNVTSLTVAYMGQMNDLELQVLSGCSRLAELELKVCSNVNIAGVFILCQRLPGLSMIRSNKCAALSELALGRCQKLLKRQLGFVVTA